MFHCFLTYFEIIIVALLIIKEIFHFSKKKFLKIFYPRFSALDTRLNLCWEKGNSFIEGLPSQSACGVFPSDHVVTFFHELPGYLYGMPTEWGVQYGWRWVVKSGHFLQFETGYSNLLEITLGGASYAVGPGIG